MNLLLITYSFPPAGGVGVLRAVSLAKYLPRQGIRVDVLSARNAAAVGRDPSLLAQLPAEVMVHRSWALDLPFTLRKWIRNRLSGRSSASSTQPSDRQSSQRSGNLFKQLIGDLLLPDPQIGWLPFAAPAARRIIRSRRIDVVLITVPPFSSAHLVKLIRRAFPTLPIVIDFRDEWLTTTIDLVSFNNNERARRIAHTVESDAIRNASAVVLVTDAARRELIERYPDVPASKFHTISNGFETRTRSSLTASLPRSQESPLILTYIGTVYGSTDPSRLVEAVLALRPGLRRRLRLRFIGHLETPFLRNQLERLGDTVELLGFLPQAQALEAMDDTDYLLLITHDRINVSAKFYDYLSGNKPIIAAVHPDGDVRRLLEETGTGYWADSSDPVAIGSLLADLVSGRLVPPQPDRARIASYHRNVLADHYAELLKGVAKGRI